MVTISSTEVGADEDPSSARWLAAPAPTSLRFPTLGLMPVKEWRPGGIHTVPPVASPDDGSAAIAASSAVEFSAGVFPGAPNPARLESTIPPSNRGLFHLPAPACPVGWIVVIRSSASVLPASQRHDPPPLSLSATAPSVLADVAHDTYPKSLKSCAVAKTPASPYPPTPETLSALQICTPSASVRMTLYEPTIHMSGNRPSLSATTGFSFAVAYSISEYVSWRVVVPAA